jgi:hypothetical protein
MKWRIIWAGNIPRRWRVKVHTDSWWEKLTERESPEDLDVDRKLRLNCILKKWNGGHGLDWPGLGKGQVRVFVNTLMNSLVLQNVGNFSTSWGPLTSQDILRAVDSVTYLVNRLKNAKSKHRQQYLKSQAKLRLILLPPSSELGSYLRLFGCQFEGITIFERPAASCLKAQPPIPE